MQLLQIQTITQNKTKKQDYIYNLIMEELNKKGLKIISFTDYAGFYSFMFKCLDAKLLMKAKNDSEYYKFLYLLSNECRAIYKNYFLYLK